MVNVTKSVRGLSRLVGVPSNVDVRIGSREMNIAQSVQPVQNNTTNVVISPQPPSGEVRVTYPDKADGESPYEQLVSDTSLSETERLRREIEIRDVMIARQLEIWTLIHHIVKTNPLQVAKYVLAEQSDLIRLVELMTDLRCELILDEDISCCAVKTKYDKLESIRLFDGLVCVGDLRHVRSDVYEFISSKGISLAYTI